MSRVIKSFDFPAGKIIANKYKILKSLGGGWEGEVYKIVEINTDIVRAAKFFYPKRNVKNKNASHYARMLHKLSHCQILIHYHTHEFIEHQEQKVTCLISEYVDGEILPNFLKHQPGGKIDVYRGLQLLHALATGLEVMHQHKSYHGDLHSDNIIIKRHGLGFELKLLDMYNWGRTNFRENTENDVCDSIKIFYDSIGGKKTYASHPDEIKEICCGLRRGLILKKFPNATALRKYLETMNWQKKPKAPRKPAAKKPRAKARKT